MIKEPVTDQEIEDQKRENARTYVRSRYEFLMGHNGLRLRSSHGLMGTTGCGKSTLMKCIIAEVAVRNRILVWLSEETVKEYQELINFLDKSILDNIVFVEEKEIDPEIKGRQSDFFEYFEQMVEQACCQYVVIDNVTTSAFYNMRFGIHGQMIAAEYIRDFPKRKNTGLIYVAHTESRITDNYNKVITPENIRGSKELSLNTEYFYIIQKFTTNEKQYNFLRVAKYRHHEEAAGWFALKYEKRSYIGDQKVPFTLVNKIFRSRDFLGRSDKVPKKDQPTARKKEPEKNQKEMKLESGND